MPVPVQIPKATLTLEEAHIVCWKQDEGSPVRKGDVLFEMETDKVIVEVPSPAEGYLLRILMPEGLAKVEQVVGWVGALGEHVDGDPISRASREPEVQAHSTPAQASHQLNEAPASPAARRRARELGLDISTIRGSGPGGRVTEKDVEAAIGNTGANI